MNTEKKVAGLPPAEFWLWEYSTQMQGQVGRRFGLGRANSAKAIELRYSGYQTPGRPVLFREVRDE